MANSLITIDLETLSTGMVCENILVPRARYGSSMHLINGELFIINGRGHSDFFTEVWAFNIESGSWRGINTKGAVPTARFNHAADSQGDSIAIWGGTDQTSTKNDLFIFNSQTSTWLFLTPVNDLQPSAAFGACLVLNIPFIYIYGGVISSGISGELWRYEMGENIYTLLSEDTPIAFASCHINSHFFYVAFGSSFDENPSPVIREFDLIKGSWRTFHEHPSVDHDSGQAVQVFLADTLIRIGGEEWMLTPSNMVDVSGAGDRYSIVGSIEGFVYNSGFAYFNTSIFIFGGGSVLGLNLRTQVPSALFLKIDLKDICFNGTCEVLCSKGTFLQEGTCQLCNPGSYSNEVGNGECFLCPAGTFNPSFGATSERQCYPCSEGTFTGSQGSAFCRDCPVNKFCPVGTTHPLEKAATTGEISIQPSLFKPSKVTDLIFIYQITAVSFYFLLMTCILSIQKLRDNIYKLDLYINLHNRDLDQRMVLKKTYCGGCFSLVFLLVLIVFVGSTVISFKYDNILESKNLVPLVVLESEVETFQAETVEIQLKFLTYGGTCTENSTCTRYLKAHPEFISGSISMSCQDLPERGCSVNLLCKNCMISPGANINIQMIEKLSYSSGIEINFKSSSSIPSESSSIFISIRPPPNRVFIGSDPSQFFFSVTPSLFKSSSSDWPWSQTGYHVSVKSPPIYGSMFETLEIPSVSYLKAMIFIEISNEALLTTRHFSQETVYFISNLLGSVFGIMGAVGGMMKSVETYYLKVLSKLSASNKTFDSIHEKRKLISRLNKLNKSKLFLKNASVTSGDDGSLGV